MQKVSKATPDSQLAAETEVEHLDQSEHESESFDQSLSSPWEPRPWPEGRKVLTHLVEGFVIQEGLQPFPVNISCLLETVEAYACIFLYVFLLCFEVEQLHHETNPINVQKTKLDEW